MNIHKLLSSIDREQRFEAEFKANPTILNEPRARRFMRGPTNKKRYIPFSERLKAGIRANLRIHDIYLQYFMNNKAVVAVCVDDPTIKRIAKCHPSDTFDLKRGIIIATSRAISAYREDELTALSLEIVRKQTTSSIIREMLQKIDATAIEYVDKRIADREARKAKKAKSKA